MRSVLALNTLVSSCISAAAALTLVRETDIMLNRDYNSGTCDYAIAKQQHARFAYIAHDQSAKFGCYFYNY
jgi:hypothetical protein